MMIYLPQKLLKIFLPQPITWVADAWKQVPVETIKNCLVKYVITEQTSEDEDDIVDEEFNSLFTISQIQNVT